MHKIRWEKNEDNAGRKTDTYILYMYILTKRRWSVDSNEHQDMVPGGDKNCP